MAAKRGELKEETATYRTEAAPLVTPDGKDGLTEYLSDPLLLARTEDESVSKRLGLQG